MNRMRSAIHVTLITLLAAPPAYAQPRRLASARGCRPDMAKAARQQEELRRVQDRIGRLFNSIAGLRGEGLALQEQVAFERRIHATLGGIAGVAKVTKAMSDMFLTVAGDATWATKVVKRQYDRLETQIGSTYGYMQGDNTKATAKGFGLVSNYTRGDDKLWSGVAGKATSAVGNLKKGEYLMAGGDALEGVSKLLEDSRLLREGKALKYAGTFIKSSKEAVQRLERNRFHDGAVRSRRKPVEKHPRLDCSQVLRNRTLAGRGAGDPN